MLPSLDVFRERADGPVARSHNSSGKTLDVASGKFDFPANFFR
jgi:hypothetical protein